MPIAPAPMRSRMFEQGGAIGSIFSDPYQGMFSGTIAFDYGARTVRLGSGIDEAEAHMIIESLRMRFPELES